MLRQIQTTIAQIVLSSFLFFVPSLSDAICLKDCTTKMPAASSVSFDNRSLLGPAYNNTTVRDRSPTIGDMKNGVAGDMNIRIGHERVDIRTDSNSNNNTIDASINSTIIMGDMNK
jgi:hypothetical protein